MDWYWLTVAAHFVLTAAYAWITVILFIGNTTGRQWRSNPLSTATFAIFLSCGIGHGTHVFHAIEPQLGFSDASTRAAAVAMGDPLLLVWSFATAAVAVMYLTIRSRLRLLSHGAPLCADLEANNARADQAHADVQRAIDDALHCLDEGRVGSARAVIQGGLTTSRGIITSLIGEDTKTRPGDLRRRSG